MRGQLTGILIVIAMLAGCQKDWLAGECDVDHPDDVYEDITPKDGDNRLAQSLRFKSCETLLCLSTNGSKPYCTKRCGSSTDCLNGNGVEMDCEIVTEFTSLACRAPAMDFCPANYEGEDPCCERDEDTNAVKDPATYCAARDGQVPHDPKAEPIGGGLDD